MKCFYMVRQIQWIYFSLINSMNSRGSLLSTSLRGLEYLSYISMDCHTLKKDLFSCRQNKNVSQSERS